MGTVNLTGAATLPASSVGPRPHLLGTSAGHGGGQFLRATTDTRGVDPQSIATAESWCYGARGDFVWALGTPPITSSRMATLRDPDRPNLNDGFESIPYNALRPTVFKGDAPQKLVPFLGAGASRLPTDSSDPAVKPIEPALLDAVAAALNVAPEDDERNALLEIGIAILARLEKSEESPTVPTRRWIIPRVVFALSSRMACAKGKP